VKREHFHPRQLSWSRAIVRIYCRVHGRSIGQVRELRRGGNLSSFLITADPEWNTLLLEDFGEPLVFNESDDPVGCWCGAGKHNIEVQPLALAAAVADYRRGTGAAVKLTV
jgi:hypothetical protein